MEHELLKELSACREAREWASQFDTLEEAWQKCERGDWMLWLAGKLSCNPESDSRKRLVLFACECARLALKYVKPGDVRPRIAIETAEAWTRGEATIEQVRADADADAADAYADAADAAAAAAYAAAADAAYAAYAAARKQTLADCANIVRKHYPTVPTQGE